MTKTMFVLIILAFSFLFAGFILSFRKEDTGKNDIKNADQTLQQTGKAESSIEREPARRFSVSENGSGKTENSAGAGAEINTYDLSESIRRNEENRRDELYSSISETDIEKSEKIVSEINESNVNEFLAKAKYEADKGNYRKALAYYEDIVRSVPSNKRVYSNIAAVKMHLGDYYGAIEDCGISIRIAPKRMNGYFNRALARIEIGDYEGAVSDANVLIENNFMLGDSYMIRGYGEYGAGNYKKAVESFAKAISKNPEKKNDKTYQKALRKLNKK